MKKMTKVNSHPLQAVGGAPIAAGGYLPLKLTLVSTIK
jgi:hypothetical protein